MEIYLKRNEKENLFIKVGIFTTVSVGKALVAVCSKEKQTFYETFRKQFGTISYAFSINNEKFVPETFFSTENH